MKAEDVKRVFRQSRYTEIIKAIYSMGFCLLGTLTRGLARRRTEPPKKRWEITP